MKKNECLNLHVERVERNGKRKKAMILEKMIKEERKETRRKEKKEREKKTI